MKKRVYDFSAAKKISMKEITVTLDASAKAFTDQSVKNAANKTCRYNETGFVCPSGVKVTRTYFAGGRVFAYCSDLCVYECFTEEKEGSSEVKRSFLKATDATFAKEPLVMPITDCGEEKIIISGEEEARLLYVSAETGARENTAANIPFGTDFAICDGRLFIASGKKIYFSEEYDCLNFSTGTENEGIIMTDGSDGDIVALQTVGEELYILCRRRILVLSPKGDIAEWTLKKQNTQSISVYEGFGAGCGKNLVFISEGRLYVYDGKTLKAAKSKLSDRFAIYYDEAVSALGAFACRAFAENNDGVYLYDPETEEEFLLPKYYGLSRTGGYATDKEGKKIYKLMAGITSDGSGGAPASIGGTPSAANRLGGNYDFGTCGRKTIVKIAVKTLGDGVIKVRGDSATKSFDLKNGYNSLNVGVSARRFRLDFTSAQDNFEPQKITFVYFES